MSVSDLISSKASIAECKSIFFDVNPIYLDAPAWLTKSYIQDTLSKFYSDKNLTILSLDARPALGRGDNYGGVLTRVKVEFRRSDGISENGFFIIKTSFEDDEFSCKTMEPYDIFNREMSIYEHILPKLNSILSEIQYTDQIFAETIAVDYKRSALIFEDLNVRNFVMPDRLVGLDLKIARLVLRKLAKMHAASAVLNERECGSLQGYDRGMFNRHTDNYAPCYLGLIQAASKRVSQWPGYEQYAKKLEALLPVYMELGKRVFDVSSGINVLAHGDLWTNNVLVKYNNETGEPMDVIIIDFQYSAWGSPAIDLFYFLNCSLQHDFHLHHQEQLIQYYFDIFSDTLRKLRYKSYIPSLFKFRLELSEKAFYAMHTSVAIFAVQRNMETEDADFNALMETNQRAVNMKNGCFNNPVTQRVLRDLLPVYDRLGLLDADQ